MTRLPMTTHIERTFTYGLVARAHVTLPPTDWSLYPIIAPMPRAKPRTHHDQVTQATWGGE